MIDPAMCLSDAGLSSAIVSESDLFRHRHSVCETCTIDQHAATTAAFCMSHIERSDNASNTDKLNEDARQGMTLFTFLITLESPNIDHAYAAHLH